MSLLKYNSSWVGIDSGREGLWKEPLWTGVLKIISNHSNEKVYDQESSIYLALELEFPKEAWRCKTAEGAFRPLFRDYPNSWTRTGVVSLLGKRFNITKLGADVLSGKITKANILVEMFIQHKEAAYEVGNFENPFSILASAFLDSNRPLNTEEIYWAVMKNYRPHIDSLMDVVKKKIPHITAKSECTPYRRLRNMLSLMRTSNLIESTRRDSYTYWVAVNKDLLLKLAKGT